MENRNKNNSQFSTVNSQLPKGWEKKKLGDVCEKIFAGGDKPKEFSKFITDEFSVPIFANGEKNKGLYGYTNIARISKPSITISGRGTIGYSEIRTQPFVPIVRLITLLPNEETVDINYLHYGLKNIDFVNSGSSIPQLTVPMVKGYSIPFPKSLPEQKRIVNILDKAFAEIAQAKANAEQNLKNAKELFESYLNGIFENKGASTGSATLWEEKTFEELSSKIGDGLHGTPEYDKSGEYFFINGNNLNDGKIEIKEDTKRINKEEFEKHKRKLTNNTVLISINGTLGKVAFYNNEPVILGKSACYINFNDEVNKHYIKYLVKSPLFFKNMGSLSTGATIKNFSLKSMRNYTLPLPPINEQKQIVIKLEELQAETQKLEAIYQKKIEDLDELKKSILQKAFNGEL